MTNNVQRAAEMVGTYEALGARLGVVRRKAMILSEASKLDDAELYPAHGDYGEEHARIAIVHTRQDVVLLCSYMLDAAESLVAARKWFALTGIMSCLTVALLVYVIIRLGLR